MPRGKGLKKVNKNAIGTWQIKPFSLKRFIQVLHSLLEPLAEKYDGGVAFEAFCMYEVLNVGQG